MYVYYVVVFFFLVFCFCSDVYFVDALLVTYALAASVCVCVCVCVDYAFIIIN
jgi:hypothetical protein